MSYEFYKLTHILGIFLLFMSLGGLALFTINGGNRSTNRWRLANSITHGVSLLLLAISGFGLAAKLQIFSALPSWIYAKILIWVLFGASIAIVSKKEKYAKILWFVLPALGLASAYLAIFKPF